MRPVDSSAIRAVGYDARRQELRIEYHSRRGAYEYHDVPPEVFAELMEADSKGSYVNHEIRDRYEYDYRPRPPGKPAKKRGNIIPHMRKA